MGQAKLLASSEESNLTRILCEELREQVESAQIQLRAEQSKIDMENKKAQIGVDSILQNSTAQGVQQGNVEDRQETEEKSESKRPLIDDAPRRKLEQGDVPSVKLSVAGIASSSPASTTLAMYENAEESDGEWED